MKVIFLPKVQEYYDNLEQILYEKGYFSFPESSKEYVKDLILDIKMNLPTKFKRPAPEHFDKYGKGMYYATFRKNKQTAWYAFFTKYNDNGKAIYLVRYIANNHTVAQHL
ncbi:MAG: hypothetical protein LBH22_07600 [Bacteroidales bacterium]|jgi:hypothetical protein|nr:hypothetical protein [Bacteroidales bacterium]